jgi:hypothetical protein
VYSFSLQDGEVDDVDENDPRLPSKRYLTIKRRKQVPKGVPKIDFSDHQNGTDCSQKPTEYGNVQFLGELTVSGSSPGVLRAMLLTVKKDQQAAATTSQRPLSSGKALDKHLPV